MLKNNKSCQLIDLKLLINLSTDLMWTPTRQNCLVMPWKFLSNVTTAPIVCWGIV